LSTRLKYLFVICGFLLWPTALSANLVCLKDWENLLKSTKEQGEVIKFIGVNGVGHAVYFFEGRGTFTLFFSPDGSSFCTNAALMGSTVKPYGRELENAFK